MSKVYLDMDGVLADFDGELSKRGFFINRDSNRFKQFVDKSQWTEEELKADSQVKQYMSEPGFFRNLAFMSGADQLWIAAGKPIVLTARPKNAESAHRVSSEKREWIEEYFGQIPEDRFICCLRSEKAKYAISWEHGSSFPIENILVDDLEWNCSEWEKAGGIAILYKNAEQAVTDLKKVMNDRN